MSHEEDEFAELNSKSKFFTIGRLFPNIVTIGALCFGLSSIRFALDEKWEMSVFFILLAAFLDGIDGRLARLLKASSDFGANLDSLSDFVSFGVAPAVVLYLWQLHNIELPRIGWAIVLFYTVCCAVRLARFNTDLHGDKPSWADKFFVGVASPAGACLALAPMVLSFEFPAAAILHPVSIGIYTVFIASLMPSRIPTFSIKKVTIKTEYVSFFLIGAGLLITGLIIEPWLTLLALASMYLGSIPISIIFHKNYQGSIKKK